MTGRMDSLKPCEEHALPGGRVIGTISYTSDSRPEDTDQPKEYKYAVRNFQLGKSAISSTFVAVFRYFGASLGNQIGRDGENHQKVPMGDIIMKKLINKKSAGMFLGTLFALGSICTANAQLVSITSGKYTINAQGYSASVLTTAPGDFARGGLIASSGQREDTWGIFQITSILDGNVVDYTSNMTYELWGMFYNSVDKSAVAFGNQILFEAEGLKLDIYRRNVIDTGDVVWQTVFNQGTGGRIDIDSYAGITDVGTLVFQSALTGTMDADFNTSTLTTNAEGKLAVSGVNTLFNINPVDMVFALAGTTTRPPSDWTVEFGGPIIGENTAIPEPSTYALFGAGILAAAIAFRRRRRNSAKV